MTTPDESEKTQMRRDRSRLGFAGVLALALCVTAGLSAGAAEGKKKKRKANPVDITQTLSLPIADETVGTPGIDGITQTAIVVGNQFRGLRIRDANVTVHISGTGTDSVGDLTLRLQAPNGATSNLIFNQAEGNVMGPTTFDDETSLSEIDVLPFDGDSTSLFPPYLGSVQPQGKPLSVMDDGGVPGTWTLVIRDDDDGNTNMLLSWRLNVITGRPFSAR